MTSDARNEALAIFARLAESNPTLFCHLVQKLGAERPTYGSVRVTFEAGAIKHVSKEEHFR